MASMIFTLFTFLCTTSFADCTLKEGPNEQCSISPTDLASQETLKCTSDQSRCSCESIICKKPEQSTQTLHFQTPNGKKNTGIIIESTQYTSDISMHILATNVRSIDFSNNSSFAYSTLNAECLSNKPCPIKCGTDACAHSDMKITNAKSFEAMSITAAELSNILFENPAQSFSLYCNGDMSCLGADIEIIISVCDGNTHNISTLAFNGDESGLNAHITINNEVEGCTVYIENWVCAMNSVIGMEVDMVGNVIVSNSHNCGDILIFGGQNGGNASMSVLHTNEMERSGADYTVHKMAKLVQFGKHRDTYMFVVILVIGVMIVVLNGYCLYKKQRRDDSDEEIMVTATMTTHGEIIYNNILR